MYDPRPRTSHVVQADLHERQCPSPHEGPSTNMMALRLLPSSTTLRPCAPLRAGAGRVWVWLLRPSVGPAPLCTVRAPQTLSVTTQESFRLRKSAERARAHTSRSHVVLALMHRRHWTVQEGELPPARPLIRARSVGPYTPRAWRWVRPFNRTADFAVGTPLSVAQRRTADCAEWLRT